MNDQPPRVPDEDDQFAEVLARKHEQLIGKTHDQDEFEPDQRVASAIKVLQLLEEVRAPHGPSQDHADTIDDPSTTNQRIQDREENLRQGMQTTLPDLHQLGRFQIIEQIGRGGYGIVVRTFDPQLERDVAIKIPRFETAISTESRTRFIREAKAAAALHHPGIVTVHETGMEQEIAFIVNEFIDGENLETLLARGQHFTRESPRGWSRELPMRFITHTSAVCCTATSNPAIFCFTMPTPNCIHWSPILAWLSIVDEQDFTQSGAFIGTPAYMSPEQASGDKSSIQSATDVYGLGTILYQLLVGQPPFAGMPVIETIRAIVDKDPVAPRNIDSKTPQDLEAICLKCLAKKPAQRYATAQELQSDLQRFLDHQPVTARRATRADRLLRWANRNPALATTLIGLFVALTIGLVTAIVLWRISEIHRLTAEQNQTKFQARSDELENLLDRMFKRIQQMPEIAVIGMETVRESMLSDVNQYYTSLLSERPNNTALQQKQGETLLRLAAIKSSLSDHWGAIQVAERLVDSIPDDPASQQVQQRIDALMLMAQDFWHLRKSDRQQRCYDEALSLARNAFVSTADASEQEQIEFAKSLSEAAEMAGLWGDRTLSNQLAQESIGIWENVPAEHFDDSATILALSKSYAAAASVYWQSEQRDVARQYGRRAIELIEQTLDAPTRQTPEVQFLLAGVYYSYGVSFRVEFEKAMSQLDRSLQIATQLASEHPLIAKYQLQIGKINYQRGLTHYVAYLVNKLAPGGRDHLDESLKIFADNIEFLSDCGQQLPRDAGLFAPTLTSCHITTGLIFGELGQYEQQLSKLEQALELAQQIDREIGSAESKERVMGIYGNMGFPYLKLKRYSEAIEKFEFANEDLEKTLLDDPENGTVARFLSGNCEFLAECYAATDQPEAALAAYRKSMNAYREGPGETMLGLEAVYLVNAKQFSEAESRFDDFVVHQMALAQGGTEWLPGVPATDQQIESALPKLVLHCGRLLTVIGQLSGDEQQATANLKALTISAAIDALKEIDTNTGQDVRGLDKLLADPQLTALKQTPQYAEWESSH